MIIIIATVLRREVSVGGPGLDDDSYCHYFAE